MNVSIGHYRRPRFCLRAVTAVWDLTLWTEDLLMKSLISLLFKTKGLSDIPKLFWALVRSLFLKKKDFSIFVTAEAIDWLKVK